MEPSGEISLDSLQTMTPFPGGDVNNWGVGAIDGGRGANPQRWYVSAYFPGVAYSRFLRSKLLRSDDDGATWTTLFDEDGGDPDHNRGKPTDFVGSMAYDPQRPDDVYAVFTHYALTADRMRPHEAVGRVVRRSHDGGVTWTDLTTGDLPRVGHLAVGIDSRYLYATTSAGVYRLALDP